MFSTGKLLFDITLTVILPFQIFFTPEGQLSSEQGVYVAEAVVAKNTKLPKGRFRLYDDQDSMVSLNLFVSCRFESLCIRCHFSYLLPYS